VRIVETLRFEQIATVPVDHDGYAPVCEAVAYDGTLLFLLVESSAQAAVFERYAKGLGTFPVTKMKQEQRFRLWKIDRRGAAQKIDLPAMDIAFPLVALFPDGKLLLAAARSGWRGPDDYDLNGLVVDPATKQNERILLGDEINDLRIDGNGQVWVSYGDEGIGGNFGWGGPGPEPVGAAGLACFSADGQKLWEFPGGAIMECYALNVAGDQVAIYYHTDFPICRISPDRTLSFWKTPLRGCNHFAISATEALFTCQYEEEPDIGHRGTLQNGELIDVRKVRFEFPDTARTGAGRLIGHGKHLYFFDSVAVYRLSLD
jgi:hypothetical protein